MRDLHLNSAKELAGTLRGDMWIPDKDDLVMMVYFYGCIYESVRSIGDRKYVTMDPKKSIKSSPTKRNKTDDANL